MNLDHMLAQLRGTLPSDVLYSESLPEDWPTCVQRRCRRPAAIKKNGQPAKSCSRCLKRRAESCKRRRAFHVGNGGCRRCAYRRRLKGDFLCARCREDRDIERAQKRQNAMDAAAIDEFAAQPERVHQASNLDMGVSPWNAARPKPEPSAAYWSPLPDPEPREEREWAKPLFETGWHFRRC